MLYGFCPPRGPHALLGVSAVWAHFLVATKMSSGETSHVYFVACTSPPRFRCTKCRKCHLNAPPRSIIYRYTMRKTKTNICGARKQRQTIQQSEKKKGKGKKLYSSINIYFDLKIWTPLVLVIFNEWRLL
eukprot:GEMP01071878.1.p1 GENE.GEMP01071878.1~~GEMP01071878.1.p1  ORF type:complete len:130 (+),score=2.23 GEMP01071878.1:363-752(+)